MCYIDTEQHQIQKETLEHGESISHPLKFSEVCLSHQAHLTLQEAVQKIAEYCQISSKIISGRLNQKLFWLEPSGLLLISIEVPEVNADMFIQIPSGHWWIDDSACQA
ncbi:MAG: hypothetical protein ACLFRL_04200 [Desulfohalobiaceae bacterium]